MPPKISLIVVEDEALIAENLRLTLEDLGYAVLATCYTFAEAETALAAHPAADLVLLDINLGSANPAHTGLALAQGLSAAGRPFIFLTAYSDLDTIRAATRLQPSGYLIKPPNPATLFAAIQTAFEHSSTRQLAPALAPLLAPLPDPRTPALTPDYFFVKNGTRTTKVFWREVAALEAGKNYVTLFVPALRLRHAVRGSLAAVLDGLVPADLRAAFVRVNRSTCLQASFIDRSDDAFVYCAGERFEGSPAVRQQLQKLGH